MKRICYVIPSLGLGGTERQLVGLVDGLVHDHEISVACTRAQGALGGDIRRAGAQIFDLNARSGWDFRIERALNRLFGTRRPDIVHSFMFGFDYWVNRAARKARVPVVISSRRQLATWKKGRHVWFQRKANRLVDCIVANSEAAAEFARQQEGVAGEMVRVVYNGIDADRFVSNADLSLVRKRYRIPFHRHVIGIVANFSPVKDYGLFVESACALLKKRADVFFLMVGSGPMLKAVQRRVAASGYRECFGRVTTIPELPDLYALMDTLVLCSKAEGFPNVIMEAMAAGTPVVAANVGGVKELVTHGETGRLVDSRNPEDFAKEIDWVLAHPNEAGVMCANAGRFIREEFALGRMAGAYRDLYAELLGKAKEA